MQPHQIDDKENSEVLHRRPELGVTETTSGIPPCNEIINDDTRRQRTTGVSAAFGAPVWALF